MRRSMLFLPGNNPNILINGNCLGTEDLTSNLQCRRTKESREIEMPGPVW